MPRRYTRNYRNKFGAQRTVRDGVSFHSKKEADRYSELSILERGGIITGLKLQVPFDLFVNGMKICRYIADSVYIEDGKQIVEDVKSKATLTPEYRIKKKLMKAILSIDIREIFEVKGK